ncbi:MAG: ABC transporter ATP-binding protein [Phycisphaerales bacterium]
MSEISANQVLTAAPTEERGDRVRPFDWRLTKRLTGRMARYPKLFWIVMALAILLAGVGSSIPVVLTETIRGLIGEESALQEWVGWRGVAWLQAGVFTLVALAVVWYAMMRARQYLVNDLAEKIVHDFRREIFAHLQSLGMDYYDRTKVGRILARGTSDVQAIRGAVGMVAPRLVISALQMVWALAWLFYYDWVLALIVILIAPVIYAASWKLRQGLSSAYRATQESYALITANLAESIAGIRVTKAFARERVNAGMFRGLCERHRDRHLRTARYQGVYVPMIDIATQLFIAIALLVGGYRVSEGLMTVGDLLGFMIMTGMFFSPIAMVADMYNVVLQGLAGAERVFRLLDTPPPALDPPDDEAEPLPRSAHGARVEFEHVTFGYNKDRRVLEDLSFVAEPGQTIAIVGHTGSGKTSIINLIGKFYLHQGGRITIDGIDLRRLRASDLHAQMGIVLQENFLFTGTVMDNIRFARPEATDDEVIAVCRRLDCLDVLERLPDGLRTVVGERGASLSLGQRQLTCFARALLADPRLLILDEATSAVDTVTEARVQEALHRLVSGRTSFVVAHRLSTIRDADRILVMKSGRLVEQGTHDELLAAGGYYDKLHREFVRTTEGVDATF